MIIITDLDDNIVHIMRVRGNTVIKSNFHVYYDKLITKEDVDNGDVKLGDVYMPREADETFYKEQ